MSEMIKSVWLYWKLATFKGANGWLIAALTAFLTFTDGPEWKTPSMRIARLVIFCLIAGNKWLDGFFDSTITNLSKSKNPLGFETDTTLLRKPETETKTGI